jgi:hypothetical protein
MAGPRAGFALERLVRPWPLLLGALASFLACCAAGAWCSRRPVYQHFERFHQLLSPEALHYPTASQVLALARAELPPDKVAVIVGGNSVLNGAGQRAERLWTKALQAALGDDYRVLNLAVRGAHPAEFGAVVAEALGRERPRVLFVTLTGYGCGGFPDGQFYQYFYWDAHAKGLLLPHPAREERLRELGPRGDPEKFAELRLQARQNAWCYFDDLWNALAYRRLSTVWAPFVWDHPFRPRQRFADPDPGTALPFEQRYGPAFARAAAAKIHAWEQGYHDFLAYRRPPGRRAREVDPEHCALVRQLRACFPEGCRPRTLVLVPHENPYYLGQLAPAEQALSRRLVRDQVRAIEGAGFAALEVGRDFTVDDCYDGGGHYTEQGGARLAAAVAPKIRALARRLGYLDTAAPGGP